MIKVVKIGGNVVDNNEALQAFCRDFASLEGPKLLVHGGGVMASRVLADMSIEPIMVEGRRVTDLETLKVVTMVYAGWANKHITALLQSVGCNAIGLSGCDGAVITAKRRAPRTLMDGSLLDYGYVGDVVPESVNAPALNSLLDAGFTPVICAINHDGEGTLLNTNADTVASSVAAAIGAQLQYCFELDGVLLNREDPSSLLPKLDLDSFALLRQEGVIAGGMLPKVENCFNALKNGALEVVIKNSTALLDDTAGTRIEL